MSTGFVAESVATAPDGKIFVVGHQGDVATGNGQAVLQRLNPDGSLDTFYGSAGQAISGVGYADMPLPWIPRGG